MLNIEKYKDELCENITINAFGYPTISLKNFCKQHHLDNAKNDLEFAQYFVNWLCEEYHENIADKDLITEKQKDLIEAMNEWCTEKFDLSYRRSKADARKYISKNIDEFIRLTCYVRTLENE